MILKQIREEDFLRTGRLFLSPLGKEVLGILNKTFYDTVSFTPGQPDVSAFKEGHRDLVQVLRSAAKAAESHDKETKDNG